MKQSLAILLAISLMTGCASTSGVKKYAESASNFSNPSQLINNNYPIGDMYRVYKRGGTGFASVEKIKADVEKTIVAFAKKKKRGYVILGQNIQANGFGRYPKVEIVFALTDKTNP